MRGITQHSDTAEGPFGLSVGQRRVTLFFVFTVLGLIEAVREYIVFNIGAQRYSWSQVITWGLTDWYLWAIFSLVIIRVTRVVGFERKHWPWNILIHLGLAVVICGLEIFLDAVAFRITETWLFPEMVQPSATIMRTYVFFLKQMGHTALIIYFLIALASYAVNYYRQYRGAELASARIQAQLAEAQLESLKSRLQPHFLFNSLNSISALIHSGPEAADRMTARLSELLRTSIENAGVQEVSLRDELEFLNRYLDIQKIRFEHRLDARFSIDSTVLDMAVPNQLLQPLVENSIHHGVSKLTRPVTVEIIAFPNGGQLCLAVKDNGPGLSIGKDSANTGFGLRSTRERLRQMYGVNHFFGIASDPAGGVEISMRIPLKPIALPVEEV